MRTTQCDSASRAALAAILYLAWAAANVRSQEPAGEPRIARLIQNLGSDRYDESR